MARPTGKKPRIQPCSMEDTTRDFFAYGHAILHGRSAMCDAAAKPAAGRMESVIPTQPAMPLPATRR